MKFTRTLLALAGPLVLAFALRAAEAPAQVEGFTFVKTAGGIANYTLDANGRDVLLLPDHSAPVITFMVTYHVGSRNEVTGTTGATHLLEHLMFKGSEHYNGDRGTGFDTLLDRIGATNNATTWLDRTNYYEEIPSNQLELAVQLESDRLHGLLLRESDRAPEMTVVRNEFERGENEPIQALSKEMNAAAFIAHPYHHPTIGWRSDIEKVSIEKLRAFYQTFYWPDNATVTVIGDFEPAAALALLKKYYGAFTRSPQPIPQIYTEEPAQQGPRRVTVKRPGETGVVGLGYKVPGMTHADHAALAVLGDILADGKTARFYRALIDTNLAISADAGKNPTHDATLFEIYSRLAPGVKHEQVEKIILDEIAKVKKDGVTADEVARAISKENASTAYARDGSFEIASQLNEDIAVGDWTLYVTMLDKIKAVTAADVQRVAKAYFNEDQSTTGWFIPLAEGGDAPAEKPAEAAKRSSPNGPHFYREPAAPEKFLARDAVAQNPGAITGGGPAASGSALIAPRVVRRNVAGIDVLSLKTSLKDVVTIRGSFPAGDVFNPAGHPAIADLTSAMLDKGTAKHDKFALSGLLEDLGAEVGFGSTAQNLAFSARCLKKDAPVVLGLLAEQLRTPAFSADEFAKLKKQLAGQYQHRLEDTNFRASQTLGRALFPEGHPNRPPESDKYLADLNAATLDDVKAFHAAHYGTARMLFVAVGDIDDAALDTAIASAFGGWTGGTPLPSAPKAAPLAAARTEKVPMPGKASVSVMIGTPTGLKFSDPDRIALAAANEIFGGGFFSSRLLAIVRAQEGLTYGIGARLAGDTYADGDWHITATFAPELLDKGVASTTRELRRFATEGVTAEELTTFKTTITGSYKIALATSAGVAGQLLATVQRSLPLAYIDEYPGKIEALTLAQVNTAVKKYVVPDKMVTVLAGTLPEAK